MQDAEPTLRVRDVVTALYRALLIREPDSDGLRGHVDSLASGASTLQETVSSFLQSAEFRVRAPMLLLELGAIEQPRFTNDQSQYGEFGILLQHWVNEAREGRIVVDVGARGKHRSNSYDLLRWFGWHGLLIEANPNLLSSIKDEFTGLDYDLMNCAVSDYEGSAIFHLGVNDDVSSLNPGVAASWGTIQGKISVDVRRLPQILLGRSIPSRFDLLSLDIEGEDLKVFNDLIDSSDYRPSWVIIEASNNFATTSLDGLDLSPNVKASYRLVDQTAANLILRLL
jgi:FkbM family methyltransferase